MSKFDIAKHKWCHDMICDADENEITLCGKYFDGAAITKDDAIAIAKHFNLLPAKEDIMFIKENYGIIEPDFENIESVLARLECLHNG